MPGILAAKDSVKPHEESDLKLGAMDEASKEEKGVHELKGGVEAIKMENSEEDIAQRSTSPDSEDNSVSSCSTSDHDSNPKSPQHTPGEEPVSTEASGSKEGTKSNKKTLGCYNIHLVLPGMSTPMDVILSPRDTVHDLLQYSFERPECCYRSCLSVRHKGKRLDEFFEIGTLEDFQDGDTVELVEEPYTQRDVRLHVQRLKDLLLTDLLSQAVTVGAAPGGEGLSLSFLAAVALTNPETSRFGEDIVDPTKLEPPPHILPSHVTTSTPSQSNDVPTPLIQGTDSEVGPPLTNFYPSNLDKYFKSAECIKSLAYSQWNPPTNRRKMKGDLLYLELTTLEGADYFITACASGFYLNKSRSHEAFDPTPKKTHHLNKHLVGLISQISPMFKKNFALLRKCHDSRHPFEVMPAPYPVLPWVAPRPEHKPVVFKIEDSMGLKPIPDELVLGQFRDWNEELQTARELPSDTVADKIFRERSLFKIHSDFVQASMRGAMAAVDGNLPTLNPGDEFKLRLYMWNNIFFSFAFDGRDHYKEFGGDAGAHAAAGGDLRGVAAHERFERKGLCTLGTVIVDYRGYRVVCQSVIPGLLHREHEAAVVYGSIDVGKDIKTDEKFRELLSKTAKDFQIRTHKLYADEKDDQVVSLPSSYEVKGIVGNDNRCYALDLFRIHPPDANYMELSEGSKFRHKMAVLRPELVETFHSYKLLVFLKLVRIKTNGLEAVQKLQKENEARLAAEIKKATKKDGEELEATKEEPEVEATKTEAKTVVESITKEVTKEDTEDSETTNNESKESSMTFSPVSTPLKSADQSSASVSPSNSTTTYSFTKSGKIPSIPGVGVRGATAALRQESTKATDSSDSAPSTEGAALPPEELYLMAGKGLEGEKDVGPEFTQEGESLPGATEKLTGGGQPLGKELEDLPEVAAAVKEALQEVGSTNLDKFELRYNVDILSPVVRHAETEEVLEKDRALVREASKFLVQNMIPQFVRDCIQLSVTPLDGEALKQAMHAKGINMRYLGEVAILAAKRDDLQHLERLCIREMITRVAKIKFRKLLQDSPLDVTSEAIVHFLNCFFGNTQSSVEPSEETPLVNGHAKKKTKKRKLPSSSSKVSPHSKITTQSLWEEIVAEVGWYYQYTLTFSSLREVCTVTNMHKVTVLRELCRKTGIQLVLRDYDFTAQPVFTEDDIASMCPLVKHTDYRSIEAVTLFEVAQSKLSAGNLLLAQELFSEALHMSLQIYGPMHVDIANCYRQVAKVNQLLGDPVNALSNQHKATLIYERVLGVDHPETLTAYLNLALYCYNTKQTAAAIRLLYRARYLILLVYGEDHPEMAVCDSNIAMVLLNIKDYRHSLVFFESTLRLYKKYYGPESLQTALTYHLKARVHAFLGDFRAALYNEKFTYNIYSKKFGVDNGRTQESYLCLKDLTGKAVTMQKTINEMTSKGSASKVMYELPGSWGEVVGMLSGQEPRQSKKPHVVRKRKRNKQSQGTAAASTE